MQQTEQQEFDFEQSESIESDDFATENDFDIEEQETQAPEPYVEKKTIIDVDGHQLEVSETMLKKFYGVKDDDPMTEREWKTALSAYKAHKKADLS